MSTNLPLDEQAAARRKRRQANTYFVAFIALGLTTAALGPTLPGLAENTQSSIGQISILFTVQSLGLLVGNLASGRWYDRLPAHPFLAGVTLVMAAGLALMPVVSSLVLLAAIAFVVGFGVGAIDVGGNTLLVWVFRRDVGPRMNALHFFFGVGALLSPIVVAQAISLTADITAAFWLLALLILAATALFLWVPSPAIPRREEDGTDEKPRMLLVVLIATMFFLFVGAEFSFGGWIYTYALKLDLATATTAGYLTSVFWGALTLGRLLSIPLAGRVRPRYILFADMAGMVLFLLVPFMAPGAGWAVWVSAFGFGLSMANVFPTLILLGERHMGITGNITGWFLVGGSLGSMTVPLLIGQGFERIGPQVTMFVILATVILAGAVLAAFLFAVRVPDSHGQGIASEMS